MYHIGGVLPVTATRGTVASLAMGALLVALGMAGSFWFFGQIERATEARKRTYDVIIGANALLSELADAETGQRGYSLTGNEAFLEPYLAVRDSIDMHLRELQQIALPGAAHQHLAVLSPLIGAKLAEMAYTIELRRNHELSAALSVINSLQGKRLMDSIRVEMGSFVRLEESTLARQEEELQSGLRRLLFSIVTAGVVVLLLVLSFAWFFYHRTRQRVRDMVHLETSHLLATQEATNKELHQANATLRDSEELLAVTLNSIGDAVITTDAAARVTRLNPIAEQLTGWKQEEANGLLVGEIFNIVNQETRQVATIPVMETLANGTIQGLANHTVLIARDAQDRRLAAGDPQQRQFLEHRHRRPRRHPDLQCGRGAHAGLHNGLEVVNKITPADISDPQEVVARAEALSLSWEPPSRRASRRWCSRPRAASRTSTN
jgi:PAS domain S-box-containing protein